MTPPRLSAAPTGSYCIIQSSTPKFYPFDKLDSHHDDSTTTTDSTALRQSTRLLKMPPKRIVVERPARGAPKGFIGSTYDMVTSSENAAVVRSIGLFGVSPASSLAHSDSETRVLTI